MMQGAAKPLGGRAYGSIPHLPGSRRGPGDHGLSEQQARICTGPSVPGKRPDKRDTIIVEEKLDGSCVSIANVRGEVIPLIRAGYRAVSSKWHQHRMFAEWVYSDVQRWAWLPAGWRVVGEWLAQAHGTLYDLSGMEPFFAFDIIERDGIVLSRERFGALTKDRVQTPQVLSVGPPCSIDDAMTSAVFLCQRSSDGVEGAVWRVERFGAFDFRAKYVRPDKADGKYLPSVSGRDPVWNWTPD